MPTTQTCATCAHPIRWATTAAGRRQALDAAPNPDGNLAAYTDGTGRLRVRVLTGERPALEHAEWRAMPHAATCTRPQPRRTIPRQRAGVRASRWQGWSR